MPAGPGFTSMNVSLPKEQKAFVDQRVRAGGFGSVSDYVRELIRRDQRELEREEVEQRLLAALESKKSKMTAADWKEVREKLVERHKGSRRT
ncbi:MAG: type II toxin-antitoxin system ParD family antitoxin [Planctomycetes bacterium]|nr:type II toxin-antitoxin system ParD family antitoxin [Planctomycetota bacterium]